MPDNLPRIGSALLVRDEADRILLGKRNKDPQRGNWIIPGGKIHAFERIAEAAARELAEETGLIVRVKDHFGVYEIISPPNEHRIVIYSWGEVIGGTPKASDDLSELKFFELDELGEVPLTPLVRQVLIDAGLLGTPLQEQRKAQQLKFALVPVLLAGATQSHTSRRSARSPRRRKRIICNSPLLFDIVNVPQEK